MSSALEERRVLTALMSLFYKPLSTKQIFTRFSMSFQIGGKRDADRGGWTKAGFLIATNGPLVFLMKTSEGLRQPCTSSNVLQVGARAQQPDTPTCPSAEAVPPR